MPTPSSIGAVSTQNPRPAQSSTQELGLVGSPGRPQVPPGQALVAVQGCPVVGAADAPPPAAHSGVAAARGTVGVAEAGFRGGVVASAAEALLAHGVRAGAVGTSRRQGRCDRIGGDGEGERQRGDQLSGIGWTVEAHRAEVRDPRYVAIRVAGVPGACTGIAAAVRGAIVRRRVADAARAGVIRKVA